MTLTAPPPSRSAQSAACRRRDLFGSSAQATAAKTNALMSWSWISRTERTNLADERKLLAGKGGIQQLTTKWWGTPGAELWQPPSTAAQRCYCSSAQQRSEDVESVDSEWVAPGCCSHMSTKFLRDVTGLSNIASFVVIVLTSHRSASQPTRTVEGR